DQRVDAGRRGDGCGGGEAQVVLIAGAGGNRGRIFADHIQRANTRHAVGHEADGGGPERSCASGRAVGPGDDGDGGAEASAVAADQRGGGGEIDACDARAAGGGAEVVAAEEGDAAGVAGGLAEV